MASRDRKLISIVVPVFNEIAGLAAFHEQLSDELQRLSRYEFEIIYCDDGSSDGTYELLKGICKADKRITLLRFTRNFGKEMATTAGLRQARGQAIITIDADGQHPVQYIREFIHKWEAGHKLVIGRWAEYWHTDLLRRIGSKWFYAIINKINRHSMEPRTTDFRLIDRDIQQAFVGLSEHNRITRGLIDWLGYRREYVLINVNARSHGSATYSLSKLLKLAVDGIIASSLSPLYGMAIIGAIVLLLSALLSLVMVVNFGLGDPLGWHATGTAYLVVGSIFLMGLVLTSQAVIGLYLSHVYAETQNRPLYVIDTQASVNL